MPTYEYACTDCGEHIEVVQSMSDAPLRVCGACGGALRKVFSPIGIVFKGSGFYKTDSRSGTGAKKPDPSTAASTSTAASGDAASASKSDNAASKSTSGSGSGKAAESA
jgi:putative FmdB family regulatory protein